MRKLSFLILCVLCISVSRAQRAPVAVNDAATIYENGSIILNVLANDSNFNVPDSVCITSVWGGYAGWDTILNCTSILFHPLSPTFVGADTFYYQSCDQQISGLCDTGRVIVNILIRAPKANNDTVTLILGHIDTVQALANDVNFNPQDSIRITNIWGAPAGWSAILDSTKVTVQANTPYYYGLYTVYYRSCDRSRPTLCDTGMILVNTILRPKAYMDTSSLTQPDTAYISVIANDSVFNALDSPCITNIWNIPTGWSNVQGCSQIDFAPADFNNHGLDTFYYSSCYTQTPSLCDTGMVIVAVTLPMPQIDFGWSEDSPCVAQVYSYSTLTDSIIWTVQYLSGNGNNDTFYNLNQFQLAANMVDSGFEVQVCLQGFNPIGDTTICYMFWTQCTFGSDGISELASAHLQVYPNPASDRLQIDISKVDPAAMTDVSSIVIYDIVGQMLKSIPVSEMGGSISVSDLHTGMYLIGLMDSKQNNKMLSKFEVVR